MEDRELLELAAKAAGVRRELMDDGEPFFIGEATDHAWNPLDYDDDAFRLAISLGIGVDPKQVSHRVAAYRHPDVLTVEVGKDLAACARRAVVRAAAEIGKALP